MISLIHFINKRYYSRDLTIPDPQIFFSIVTSVPDATAVNPNGIKTLLANVVCAFYFNGKQTLINSLSGNLDWKSR